MKLPLELVSRGVALPSGTREEIHELASRLDRFCGRIMRGRVTVERRAGHSGAARWALRVSLTVPGAKIVVTRQKGERLSEVIQEAFAAATRRLEDYVRRRRGFVKAHTDRGGLVRVE